MTTNVKNVAKAQVGQFSWTGFSVTTLLDNAGGSDYSLSITKGAGTDILCHCGVIGHSASNDEPPMTVYVNDGTTNWAAGRGRVHGNNTGNTQLQVPGIVMLTGLGAGTYTLKLAMSQALFVSEAMRNAATNRNWLTAMEVGTGAINAVSLTNLYSANFATGAAGYTDILNQTGGTALSATFTKATGSSNILVRMFSTNRNNGAAASKFAVKIGATDYEVGVVRESSNGNTVFVGEQLITGIAAGSVVGGLRVQRTANTDSWDNGVHSVGMSMIEVS